MFGYVCPLRAEMKVREWEEYQAVYCGLCHALKKKCGFLARFTLNYDFVFLALLLDSRREKPICAHRCAAHPLRPKRCLEGDESLDLAAEESVILTYYKLLDGREDEGFWRGLGCSVAALLLKRSYRRAAQAQPDFDRQVQTCLEELHRLEQENSPELDKTADTFARILQTAAPVTGSPEADRPMAQLLYHLGRWIYLADGADDLQEDVAKGRYNPVNARFGGHPDMEYLATTMTHSLSLCQSAFQLLPKTNWSDHLANILYLGLPAVQKAALAGRWSKNQKKGGLPRE